MKKRSVLTLVLLIIAIVLLTLLATQTVSKKFAIGWMDRRYNGAYYFDFNFFWCKDHVSCIHEIGHMMDDKLGMISQSTEFAEVLDYAGTDNSDKCEYCVGIMAETYAKIFTDAMGEQENMPEYLQKYYDWNLAKGWINKYPQDVVYFGTP